MRMNFEEASAILFSVELCANRRKEGNCPGDCVVCNLRVTQAEFEEAKEVMANTNM